MSAGFFGLQLRVIFNVYGQLYKLPFLHNCPLNFVVNLDKPL